MKKYFCCISVINITQVVAIVFLCGLNVSAQGQISAAENNPELAEILTNTPPPGFATRLAHGSGITPPPRFKPDYALRLQILTSLRAAVTDENAVARLEQARARIAQRASAGESP